MVAENIYGIIDEIRKKAPLVHSITNYVTINSCADLLLACGASPVMADDEREAAEITALSSALVLNTGTLHSDRLRAMLSAGKKANELGIPVVLDPVGAGASAFRTESVMKLAKEIRFTVVRGNISEILTLLNGEGRTSGVDSNTGDAITEDNINEKITSARELSIKLGCTVAVTGKIDIVTDSEHTYLVRNGHQIMSRITGTGCMLTALTAACCAASPGGSTEAALCAVTAMGYCGERAYEKTEAAGGGTGTFRMLLMDEVSLLTSEKLERGAEIEAKS